MDHYQMKPAQFSDAIGMQRSALSHVLSGRNKPSLDFVLRIKKRFPEIRLDWLLLGKGEMFVSDSVEKEDSVEKQPSFSFQESEFRNEAEKTGNLGNSPPATQEKPGGREDVQDQAVQFATLADQAERIVIFYPDQTFRDYRPRKK